MIDRHGLVGIWHRPYIDLEPLLDLGALDEVHEEICLGLATVDVELTGGGLTSMGVTSPSVRRDPYLDYGEAIAALTPDERRRFVSLADEPELFDPDELTAATFGDETDHPLSRAQELWLSYAKGVYFPWKVAYHFVQNDRWDDKHSGAGKSFGAEAERVFPKTVRFLRGLPFREIGRCLVFGLAANDHAPVHRDAEPGQSLSTLHAMSICPARNKRFFLTDPTETHELCVPSRAYWFNEADYHGVHADPFFRYSIRVDGVFDDAFFAELSRRHGAAVRGARKRTPSR